MSNCSSCGVTIRISTSGITNSCDSCSTSSTCNSCTPCASCSEETCPPECPGTFGTDCIVVQTEDNSEIGIEAGDSLTEALEAMITYVTELEAGQFTVSMLGNASLGDLGDV